MRISSALTGLALLAGFAGGGLLAEEPQQGMTIKEGILDEVVIKTASFPKEAGVVIRAFDATRADLGTAEKGDNEKRVEAAKMMQREAPGMLSSTLVQTLSLGGTFVFAKETTEAPPENAVVVEGRFTMINPGSRAKRWALGFGAGKSGIAVEGTIKNAKGDVLAEFKHMRHSGIGIAGGDYVKFLSDDTKDVARDIGLFLKRWASGGDLKEE